MLAGRDLVQGVLTLPAHPLLYPGRCGVYVPVKSSEITGDRHHLDDLQVSGRMAWGTRRGGRKVGGGQTGQQDRLERGAGGGQQVRGNKMPRGGAPPAWTSMSPVRKGVNPRIAE